MARYYVNKNQQANGDHEVLSKVALTCHWNITERILVSLLVVGLQLLQRSKPIQRPMGVITAHKLAIRGRSFFNVDSKIRY